VKAAAPTPRQRISGITRNENMLATKIIVGITVAAFIVIGLRDNNWDGAGRTAFNLELYGPLVHQGEWWRIFTVALVHIGFLHLFFNMLLLWIIGQLLEPGAGPTRVALLYVVSVASGSAAALLVQPHVLSAGASGGVFGVAAAATLVMQRQGTRFWDTGFGPLLVLNLVLGFFDPHISISAHIGGLIGGLLAAEAMLQARKIGRPELGLVGAALVGVAAFVLALAVAR
jgi:membrane associated rhomboid family serine protease